MLDNTIWYEKYAPRTLEQCFLPSQMTKALKSYVRKKDVPNLILSGPAGIGKTTAARVVLDLIGAEYIKINGSIDGDISTLRTRITQFASTMSFNGSKKYVLVDEADGMTLATQTALRGFIDEYSANCGWIFTCNYREKILAPIAESRMTELSFMFEREERPELAKKLYERLMEIFKAEEVTFDVKAVQQFVVSGLKSGTDIRRLIVQAQKVSDINDKVFNLAAVSDVLNTRFAPLVEAIKKKNFPAVRTWVGENSDIEPSRVFRYFFDYGKDFLSPQAQAPLVLILADFQHKQAFVADSEINITAFIVTVMTDCM